MTEPAPFDNLVRAGTMNGQLWDLVEEIVRDVQGQLTDATPTEVADEVRLRLDRLERAWHAALGQWTGNDCLIRGQPAPSEADPRSSRSANALIPLGRQGHRHATGVVVSRTSVEAGGESVPTLRTDTISHENGRRRRRTGRPLA